MSTYSSNLKIELIGTGEQAGTWGVTTDNNFSNVFEQSIVGQVGVPFSDADVTLTATNSVSSQSFRNVYLNCTGTNTASRNLIVPTINKNYVVQNNTTGGFPIVVKTSAGTGITVPAGLSCTVYADGTNVIQGSTYFPVATVGTLTITGGTTVTGDEIARSFYANGAFAGSYTDGIVMDYVTGIGRLTVGSGDGITFYTGGTGARSSIGSVSSAGAWTLPSVTDSGLTSGRVTYATTGGLLTDSANMTFNGTTLTLANDASISGLTVGKGSGGVTSNTVFGSGALAASGSGGFNIAIGNSAFAANTTGNQGNAVGCFALKANTTGYQNNAFGTSALIANTTGNDNQAFGQNTLVLNTTGSSNIAIGTQTLQANTTASNNTAVGHQAGYSNTTGVINAFGSGSLYSNTSGTDIAAFGINSLNANTTGSSNSAFGIASLRYNTTGSSNTAVGATALFNNTTASNNTVVGYQAGYTQTTADRNAILGTQAGYAGTTGSANAYVGYQTGYANTTGYLSAALGAYALASCSTGVQNTAIGAYALNVATGSNNVAVGKDAGVAVTTGTLNTLIGLGAGYAITSGSKNTILGAYSGNGGGLDIRTASNYIVLSDGDGNPRMYFDGTNWSCGNGVQSAFLLNGPTPNGSGASLYGQANGTTNWLVGTYGNLFGGTNTYLGAKNASGGGVYLNGSATSWSAFSDERLKDVTGTYTNALADIAQIEAVKFTWKFDEKKKPQVGVIAQSVINVVPEAVDTDSRVSKEDETEYLSVRYTELIPLLIASVQELKAEIDFLKQQLGK
jgi:hypothetical protein